MSELLAVVEGDALGTVHADRNGLLTFGYEPAWLESESSFPLSMSMPLSTVTYRQRQILPFLWNLLPENAQILERWSQQFHVSANNPFKLLTHVGEDVPGAAQFIPPNRLEEYRGHQADIIHWITDTDLAQRIHQLRDDFAAFRLPNDRGRMSLPGAQPKTALFWDGARWGVPSGRTPTTHILKPCVPNFAGLVENEHLCQQIAARCGLLAAKTFVLPLEEPVIVIERYDRLPVATERNRMQRIHQEDLCQALGLMPAAKYQEDGGPGIKRIVELLRAVSSSPDEDVERFLAANMFNWYIGGTDAHAKNYSLLIAAHGEVRLAPLYDLSTQLPYQDQIQQRVAMKVGEHYEIRRIGLDAWRTLADSCDLQEDSVTAQLVHMGETLADHVTDAARISLEQGLSKTRITDIAEQLIAHIRLRLDSVRGLRG